LVLCWLAMLGNVLLAGALPTIVRYNPRLFVASIETFVICILSFCCAFILLRRALREDKSRNAYPANRCGSSGDSIHNC
jgi:hypothetical protein